MTCWQFNQAIPSPAGAALVPRAIHVRFEGHEQELWRLLAPHGGQAVHQGRGTETSERAEEMQASIFEVHFYVYFCQVAACLVCSGSGVDNYASPTPGLLPPRQPMITQVLLHLSPPDAALSIKRPTGGN